MDPNVVEEKLIEQLKNSPWIMNPEFRTATLIVLFIPLVDAVTVVQTLARHPEFEIDMDKNSRSQVPRRRFAIPQAELGNKYSAFRKIGQASKFGDFWRFSE